MINRYPLGVNAFLPGVFILSVIFQIPHHLLATESSPRIRGQILRADGTPAAFVSVELDCTAGDHTESLITHTDAEGKFCFENLNGYDYCKLRIDKLRIPKDDEPRFYEGIESTGQAIEAWLYTGKGLEEIMKWFREIRLTKDSDVDMGVLRLLRKGFIIRGRILIDGKQAGKLDGLKVCIRRPFENDETFEYFLIPVRADGTFEYYRDSTVPARAGLKIGILAYGLEQYSYAYESCLIKQAWSTEEITLNISSDPGIVSGVATFDGRPLVGASVFWSKSASHELSFPGEVSEVPFPPLKTNVEGAFTIKSLPKGKYDVWIVGNNGLCKILRGIEIAEKKEHHLTIDMTADGPTGEIRCQLVFTLYGRPNKLMELLLGQQQTLLMCLSPVSYEPIAVGVRDHGPFVLSTLERTGTTTYQIQNVPEGQWYLQVWLVERQYEGGPYLGKALLCEREVTSIAHKSIEVKVELDFPTFSTLQLKRILSSGGPALARNHLRMVKEAFSRLQAMLAELEALPEDAVREKLGKDISIDDLRELVKALHSQLDEWDRIIEGEQE